MKFLHKKMLFKDAFLIFAVYALIAATFANFTLKNKQIGIGKESIGAKEIIEESNNEVIDTTVIEQDKTNNNNVNNRPLPPEENDLLIPPVVSPPAPVVPPNPPPPPPQPPPPPPPSNKTITITINDSGFYSHLYVTINRGDTIRWVNNDDRRHWPISDPHPEHDNYPEFDSQEIRPGKEWSFTFQKKGNWGWHDERSLSNSGTITVI